MVINRRFTVREPTATDGHPCTTRANAPRPTIGAARPTDTPEARTVPTYTEMFRTIRDEQTPDPLHVYTPPSS